jgi:ribosomal protein L44E
MEDINNWLNVYIKTDDDTIIGWVANDYVRESRFMWIRYGIIVIPTYLIYFGKLLCIWLYSKFSNSVAWAIIIGIIVFLIILTTIIKARCPNCKKFDFRVVYDEKTDYSTERVIKTHKQETRDNRSGEVVYTTDVPIEQDVTTKHTTRYYRCRFCGYEGTEVHSRKT